MEDHRPTRFPRPTHQRMILDPAHEAWYLSTALLLIGIRQYRSSHGCSKSSFDHHTHDVLPSSGLLFMNILSKSACPSVKQGQWRHCITPHQSHECLDIIGVVFLLQPFISFYLRHGQEKSSMTSIHPDFVCLYTFGFLTLVVYPSSYFRIPTIFGYYCLDADSSRWRGLR